MSLTPAGQTGEQLSLSLAQVLLFCPIWSSVRIGKIVSVIRSSTHKAVHVHSLYFMFNNICSELDGMWYFA